MIRLSPCVSLIRRDVLFRDEFTFQRSEKPHILGSAVSCRDRGLNQIQQRGSEVSGDLSHQSDHVEQSFNGYSTEERDAGDFDSLPCILNRYLSAVHHQRHAKDPDLKCLRLYSTLSHINIPTLLAEHIFHPATTFFIVILVLVHRTL